MKVQLDLEQRVWLIDYIGSLPCTTSLIKIADPTVAKLAPSESEVAVEGIEFYADETGLHWNQEVEAAKIPKLEIEIDDSIVTAIKSKIESSFEDPSKITLKMIKILGI